MNYTFYFSTVHTSLLIVHKIIVNQLELKM